MTMTIDEALNRAEAMSAGLNWILLSQYEVRAEYASPEVSIDLDNRVIGDLSENVSTEGENNSEYISFIMDRYHDGVDLSNMLIQVQYELEDGSSSIDGVVNAYMNDEQIKFGWVVPPAAAQVDAVIKIMVFCTGTLGANTYTLKTLPMEYTIHSTLKTGGSIPQPDENWYLQFANTMQQNVLSAKESADAAAQSASNANDDLADIKAIQSDVNSSKSTVQTLTAQVQSNTTKAQASADAAKASEETAKSWAERAQEFSGVNYASKELAGIVAPQDVYVNPENGHMSLITSTTDKTLPNSYPGGIKINEVQGKSEQGSTTGKNLLDCSGLTERTIKGVTFTPVYENGLLQYINVNGTATEMSMYYMHNDILSNICPYLVEGTTYILNGTPKGVNGAYVKYHNTYRGGGNDEDGNGVSFVAYPSERYFFRIDVLSGVTVNNLKYYPMIRLATIEDSTYEPYTGGIPSPNPDYPQEIKSVEVREIKSVGKNLIDKLEVGNINASGVNEDNVYITRTQNYIPVKGGTLYSISTYDVTYKNRIVVYMFDRNFNLLSRNPLEWLTNNGTVSITGFTTSSDTSFIRFCCEKTSINADKIQLEEGTVTSYEPYQSSTITLSSPITLRGIGDTKDRIVRKDGMCGIERNVAEIASYNGESITTEYISTTGGLDTGATVDYVLSATTFEPLPEADQKAFHTLQSFATVTYISTDSEIEPVIDLEYGTSRVGALALQNENDKEILELENDDLQSSVSDLMSYVGYTDDTIYGVEVDFTNKKFTRLAGAAELSAGSDFDSIAMFGGRRRCNVADDGTVNAYYGDTAYAEDGSNGQVMVEQPKFYYKVVPLELEKIQNGSGYHMRKVRYYVSETPRKGFKLHPAFIRNGVENDFIYLSAYEGCTYDISASAYKLDDAHDVDWTNDVLASIAGAKPTSGLTQSGATRNGFRTIAAKRGAGWTQQTVQAATATELLFLIEYASFNMQSAIGIGVTNKSGDEKTSMTENTGATASLGNSSGSVTNTNGYNVVSYRGEESFFGNIWKWIDGINIYNYGIGSVHIADHGFADNTQAAPYEDAGITIVGANGYVSAFAYNEEFDWLFMASEVAGNSSLPVGDYFYQNRAASAYTVARLGGCWSDDSSAGGFYWFVHSTSSDHYRSVGGRLLYVPEGTV